MEVTLPNNQGVQNCRRQSQAQDVETNTDAFQINRGAKVVQTRDDFLQTNRQRRDRAVVDLTAALDGAHELDEERRCVQLGVVHLSALAADLVGGVVHFRHVAHGIDVAEQ